MRQNPPAATRMSSLLHGIGETLSEDIQTRIPCASGSSPWQTVHVVSRTAACGSAFQPSRPAIPNVRSPSGLHILPLGRLMARQPTRCTPRRCRTCSRLYRDRCRFPLGANRNRSSTCDNERLTPSDAAWHSTTSSVSCCWRDGLRDRGLRGSPGNTGIHVRPNGCHSLSHDSRWAMACSSYPGSDRRPVRTHNVVIKERAATESFRQRTEECEYQAICEPCSWEGEWRFDRGNALFDGEWHCKHPTTNSRIIERDGRKFEVYPSEQHVVVRDWCETCGCSIWKGGNHVGGRTVQKVSKRLERAIRRRLKRAAQQCGRCNAPKFNVDEVLVGESS